jgi:hypothetical protein
MAWTASAPGIDCATTWSPVNATMRGAALWGMNTGWDNLTEQNAAWSVDLLDRLQLILAGLLRQIATRPISD